MERKEFNLRIFFTGLYIIFFATYFIVGLQPVEAVTYEISAELSIPSIDLYSDVTSLRLKERKLETPDEIVGSFRGGDHKTLLIGHSSSVFKNLNKVQLNEVIIYDEDSYVVKDIYIIPKDELYMADLLKAEEEDTIVIMTCAGEDLGDGDATHRLIVTAKKV